MVSLLVVPLRSYVWHSSEAGEAYKEENGALWPLNAYALATFTTDSFELEETINGDTTVTYVTLSSKFADICAVEMQVAGTC